MAAGVQIGDVLLSINNFNCQHVTPDHVTEYINRSSAAGQPLTLCISRYEVEYNNSRKEAGEGILLVFQVTSSSQENLVFIRYYYRHRVCSTE